MGMYSIDKTGRQNVNKMKDEYVKDDTYQVYLKPKTNI